MDVVVPSNKPKATAPADETSCIGEGKGRARRKTERKIMGREGGKVCEGKKGFEGRGSE